jgi:aspartyl-tRNA(Asn)/glutamyl-tRNA(Gln) amidotransferase subunit A
MIEPATHCSRREFVALGVSAAVWSALPAFAAPPDLASLTVRQAADLLRRRGASPVDLTEACLTRIDRLKPAINAFITVTREQALATAREMAAEQKSGKWRGPLHGIPIALKDNIDTAGTRTTAASGVFKDRIPAEDAEVVVRLKRAGAILLGKLNLHEFALGGTSAVTYFGPVHNPWALDHVPGGSSGGSAAAIAADLCLGTLGTDTGGSIRIPSSYCGVVGFKPTYGRVSNRGVIPMAWTFDHVGPICKTVEDAAVILGVIAGYDQFDPSSAEVPTADYSGGLRASTVKLRLGVPRALFFDNLDPEVANAVDAALDVLRRLTASVKDVQIPAAGNIADVWNAEIYAYNAPWITRTPELYQEATRTLIQRAGEGKSPAYAQARHQVEIVRRDIQRVFTDVDLLITPTQRGTAPLIVPAAPAANTGGRATTAAGGGSGIYNTAAFDVFGLPTISVPCGFSASGLPIGLQISGAPFAEATVVALAAAYERATDWHTKRPRLTV